MSLVGVYSKSRKIRLEIPLPLSRQALFLLQTPRSGSSLMHKNWITSVIVWKQYRFWFHFFIATLCGTEFSCLFKKTLLKLTNGLCQLVNNLKFITIVRILKRYKDDGNSSRKYLCSALEFPKNFCFFAQYSFGQYTLVNMLYLIHTRKVWVWHILF